MVTVIFSILQRWELENREVKKFPKVTEAIRSIDRMQTQAAWLQNLSSQPSAYAASYLGQAHPSLPFLGILSTLKSCEQRSPISKLLEGPKKARPARRSQLAINAEAGQGWDQLLSSDAQGLGSQISMTLSSLLSLSSEMLPLP